MNNDYSTFQAFFVKMNEYGGFEITSTTDKNRATEIQGCGVRLFSSQEKAEVQLNLSKSNPMAVGSWSTWVAVQNGLRFKVQ